MFVVVSEAEHRRHALPFRAVYKAKIPRVAVPCVTGRDLRDLSIGRYSVYR